MTTLEHYDLTSKDDHWQTVTDKWKRRKYFAVKINKQPVDCDAQLAAQTYKPSKLGQTDLVFGLW